MSFPYISHFLLHHERAMDTAKKDEIQTFSAGEWLYSDVQIIQHDYTMYSMGNDLFSRSSNFADKLGYESQWTIDMICRGFHEPWLCSLELKACNRSDIRAVFDIWTKLDGHKYVSGAMGKPDIFTLNKKIYIEAKVHPDIRKFFVKFPRDYMYVYVRVAILDGKTTIARRMDNVQPCPAYISEMNLSKRLEDGKFSDITIVVGEQEFHAHKCILSARSDVFAAMFEHTMEETTTNRIEITDFEPTVIQEMLNFIYSSRIDNLKGLAKDLLRAGDKYAIPQLMELCENQLRTDLHVDTATEVLVIAYLCNANRLKEYAMEFINLNGLQVMATIGWKNLIKAHSQLLLEVLETNFKNQLQM